MTYTSLTGRNDRVQKFTADGEFVMSIGAQGDEKGQFNRPGLSSGRRSR